MSLKIGPKQKLVMIGDSITDCGRVQPQAEGLFDPLGRGYVTMVDALINATYPDRGIRIVNVGTSGHQTRHLKDRWQKDVIDLKPDWLSVMIGTNDVWRQFDIPKMTEQHVLPDEYESNYKTILDQVRPSLKGLVLMTPFFVEANKQDAMRARMDQYGQIVKKLAEKYDAVFVDVQAAIDAALKHLYSGTLAWDRVHPNQTGHMIIAKAFLNGIGFKWEG
jgi:lysophospholipase L1-like esterase